MALSEERLREYEHYLEVYKTMGVVEKMRSGDETIARTAEVVIPLLIAEVRMLREALEWVRDCGTDYQSINKARAALNDEKGNASEGD